MKPGVDVNEILDRLQARYEAHGVIGEHQFAVAGDEAGCSAAHIRRLLVERHGRRRGPRWQVREWLLPLLYAHMNLTALHDDLMETRRELADAGAEIPAELAEIPAGYATFRRAFKELPDGVRLFAREGTNGLRRRFLYLRWQAEHRNAIWQADTCQLDIWILPRRAKVPIRPWLIIFLDDCHRLVVGAALCLATPTAEEAAATCVRAMRLKPFADGTGVYGGRPLRILVDNGPEYRGLAFTILETAIGFIATPVLRHTPTLKGKVERFFGTLQRWALASLPGYTKSPKSWSGENLFRGDLDDLLDEYELWAHLSERIDYYNLRRRHRALQSTPAASWNTDQTPLVEITAEQLREAMLRDHTLRVALADGVHYRNRLYVADSAAYDDWIGHRVQIGYLPHETGFIEIFTTKGVWITTAVDATRLDEDQARAITGRRFAAYDRVREHADLAAELRTERRRQIDPETGVMPRLTPTLLSRRTGNVTAGPAAPVADPDVDFLNASTRPIPAPDTATAADTVDSDD